jgi:hypothetical protein
MSNNQMPIFTGGLPVNQGANILDPMIMNNIPVQSNMMPFQMQQQSGYIDMNQQQLQQHQHIGVVNNQMPLNISNQINNPEIESMEGISSSDANFLQVRNQASTLNYSIEHPQGIFSQILNKS